MEKERKAGLYVYCSRCQRKAKRNGGAESRPTRSSAKRSDLADWHGPRWRRTRRQAEGEEDRWLKRVGCVEQAGFLEASVTPSLTGMEQGKAGKENYATGQRGGERACCRSEGRREERGWRRWGWNWRWRGLVVMGDGDGLCGAAALRSLWWRITTG